MASSSAQKRGHAFIFVAMNLCSIQMALAMIARQEPKQLNQEPRQPRQESTQPPQGPMPSRQEPRQQHQEPAQPAQGPTQPAQGPMPSRQEPLQPRREPMKRRQEPPQPRQEPAQASFPSTPCTNDDLSSKKIDLVLYGATGYIGKLAAQYLAKGHTDKPVWAIAGRSQLKLNYLRNSQLGNKTSDPEVIWAGLKKHSTLISMAQKAKVILNFAGPFEKYGGEALIRAALQGCAHYVDISTETYWNAQMLKKYGSIATARGVALVQSAGFASLAADFLAMSAIDDATKLYNALPGTVHVVWTKLNDGNSGGQIATSKFKSFLHGPVLDAYILSPETPTPLRVDMKVDGMDSYGFKEALNKTLESSTLAYNDCPVIRRSIFTKFQKSISVHEAADMSLPLQRVEFLNNPKMLAVNPAVNQNPPPGQGPPFWVREMGSFAGAAFARGNGPSVQVSVEGRGSPNSVGTAKMATELALGLAMKSPDGAQKGYLTPALALGTEVLEKRLSQVDYGKFITITHGH